MISISEWRQALANLMASKLRSFLAVLGILVGTASVVTLVSCGEMATEKAMMQFKHLGTDLLSMSIYNDPKDRTREEITTISLDDVAQIQAEFPEITQIAAYTLAYLPISYHGRELPGSIIGSTKALQDVVKIKLKQGHFISSLNKYQRYCVVGKDIAKTIRQNSHQPILGQQIWLGDQIYTILGVAEPWQQSSFLNTDVNHSVIVPIQSSHLLGKNNVIRNLVMTIDPKADSSVLTDDLNQYFTDNFAGLKLFIRNPKEFIQSMKSQHRTLTLLLGLIGSVSLLVGGIGVMNIMLVSVTERRREIGIRKAIGARAADIQRLFLYEAIVLSLFGGGLGILISLICSYIIAYFAGWPFSIYLFPLMIGFIVSACIGVFFGFYPARRAAKLDPIQALRSE